VICALRFVSSSLLVVGCLSAAAISGPPPGNYQVTPIATGATWAISPRRAINNSGQVIVNRGNSAFLWNPVAANATVGNLTDLGGLATDGPATNVAIAINGFGQVIGTTGLEDGTNTRPFLWTPGAPNGTSGSMTAFLGDVTGTPTDINSYGEIGASGLLWIPSSPNASTGTPHWDNRLQGLVRINDLGQAIGDYTLFTPTAPEGTKGSLTPVIGLPQSMATDVLDINAGGLILGIFNPGPGIFNRQAFLWTPTTPNGTSATVHLIPLPPNVLSMTPVALNASGQVAGWMKRNDGIATPFLYTAGTLYDLNSLDDRLQFGTDAGIFAVGINDLGQIVVNAGGNIYLLTPGTAPPAPAAGSVAVTITANVGSQAFTVTGDGCSAGGYSAPQTLYWTPGSSCTVAFVSPLTSFGTRYDFTGWQDGVTTNSRVFAAPAQAATYTANFSTQYLLTVAANLTAGGTVARGGWYGFGSQVTVTATPAAGYRIVSYSPSATVTMDGPMSVIVNFSLALPTPPGHYQVLSIATNGTAVGLNNFGQAAVSSGNEGDGYIASLWTPLAANSGLAGNLTQVIREWAGGINDRGQVVGGPGYKYGPPFLWSPDTPNGTSGTAENFLGSIATAPEFWAYPGTLKINSFGQISGQIYFIDPQQPIQFLWTPSEANGATGTADTDSRFAGVVRVNDFGQAIMGGGPLSPPLTSTLFTPSSPNGSTGTFTPISGLPGFTYTSLVDIDDSGTIVGSNCTPGVNAFQCKMFLWTPTSLNGTAGTTVEIPMPAGFFSMAPAALNARGNIVGSLSQPGGVTIPFLYLGGAVYDLSTISDQLTGGSAAGINDRGQIVVNTSNGVFLLTPDLVEPPTPVSVSPSQGSGTSQTMTFTFQDSRGWQDLDVVNILINNALDGRNACYLAYSRPLNVLYLVNDAGTGLLTSTANSQCTVSVVGTPSGSGNTLTLTLSLSFSSSFAGNQIVYLAARDVAQNNSGWQAWGVWQVPGASPATTTAVTAMYPASTIVSPGNNPSSPFDNPNFIFIFSDTNGYQDLGVVNILVNSSLDGRHACYMAYAQRGQYLFLVGDDGVTLGPGKALAGVGGAAGIFGSISNSQCTVSWSNYSPEAAVVQSGNNLTLTLRIQFANTVNQIFYLAARDVNGLNNTGWQAMGVASFCTGGGVCPQ